MSVMCKWYDCANIATNKFCNHGNVCGNILLLTAFLIYLILRWLFVGMLHNFSPLISRNTCYKEYNGKIEAVWVDVATTCIIIRTSKCSGYSK